MSTVASPKLAETQRNRVSGHNVQSFGHMCVGGMSYTQWTHLEASKHQQYALLLLYSVLMRLYALW
jgi:hypothetical protein